jgi:5,10-methylenetetrahydrofolate reductase
MPIKDKIGAGEFVILGELEPPKGSDFSPLLKNANFVRNRVDALVVPEMANAVMKASSLGGCAFLKSNGFEPVLQVCCRDRNRLALQADILAAAGLGISNLMAVNGDDISFGDHHNARAVNDLDLMELISGVSALQQGKDMAGIELRNSPTFFLGSSLNAGATGGALGLELDELKEKLGMGVEFVVTTPIFDIHRFRQLMKRMEGTQVNVIPTIMLLKSAGMARYIDRNIRNISIPAEIIKSIQKAPDKIKQCIKVAGELIGQIKDLGAAGIMISTMGWEDKLPLVLDEAGL